MLLLRNLLKCTLCSLVDVKSEASKDVVVQLPTARQTSVAESYAKSKLKQVEVPDSGPLESALRVAGELALSSFFSTSARDEGKRVISKDGDRRKPRAP